MSSWSGVRTLEGQPYFVVLQRGETMDDGCLRCHLQPSNAPAQLVERYGAEKSFNRYRGEVVSALSIRIPLAEAYGHANQFSWHLTGFILVVLLCLYVVQCLVTRKLVVLPLRTLRDKVVMNSRDSSNLGESMSLAGSLEIREVAEAFNALTSSLRSYSYNFV